MNKPHFKMQLKAQHMVYTEIKRSLSYVVQNDNDMTKESIQRALMLNGKQASKTHTQRKATGSAEEVGSGRAYPTRCI